MGKRDFWLLAKSIGIEMFHKQGLVINRPRGSGDFVFIHFLTPVELLLGSSVIRQEADSCIVYAPPYPQHYRSAGAAAFGNNWMHFTGTATRPLLKTLGIPLNMPFTPLATAFIPSGLRRINDEKVRRERHWQIGLDNNLRSFFLMLGRNLPLPEEHEEKEEPKLREEMLKLHAALQENCYEDWPLERMAEEVHLSRSRFSVLYRQLFRISPVADLLHMRIDLAKYYLGMMQMMNVEDIAQSCGFSSVYYFHRQFKKISGMTPREFQRNYKGDDLHPPHHGPENIWP